MIILFTDFGIGSPYQAQLKAALHMTGNRKPVIDLFSDLPAYNSVAAAYLLAAYVQQFPPGSVFLCVVDPGVGSDRKALVLRCRERWFVGPDNGLFSVLPLHFEMPEVWQIVWQPEQLSRTFHGRDLFAPIAARLAQGNLRGLRKFNGNLAGKTQNADLYQIIYCDAYGNLFSGLRAAQIGNTQTLRCGPHVLHAADTFSQVPEGKAFWYENSVGLVEFAINRGNAAAVLGIGVGEVFSADSR